MPTDVHIFVHGACSGYPGPGGWAYLVKTQESEYSLNGGDPRTTTQRMELTAAIKALESLKEPTTVIVYSDSEYLIKGMTKWISGWIKKGWKTSQRKPVLNQDLWQQLLTLTMKSFFTHLPHRVNWIWVAGHSGNRESEIVNKMAQEAILKNARR